MNHPEYSLCCLANEGNWNLNVKHHHQLEDSSKESHFLERKTALKVTFSPVISAFVDKLIKTSEYIYLQPLLFLFYSSL